MKVAILTVSDATHRGERQDRSGPAIGAWMAEHGHEVVWTGVVPDEAEAITGRLLELADRSPAELVVTTGGTGFALRDVTPEATAVVLDRPAPGLAELMRLRSLEQTPLAALSRAVAGIRGTTLILNLPGSPKAVIECLEAVAACLDHGVDLLQGRARGHSTSPS